MSPATCNCTAITTGSLELRKIVGTAKIVIDEIASKKPDENSEILNGHTTPLFLRIVLDGSLSKNIK
jgi:hypothetical protein